MTVAIGAIADDLTGATDLASALAARGLRTIVTIGTAPVDAFETDAIVVALKSRSVVANEAVASSLRALRELLAVSPERLFFKYCSTFDSTPAGNIGPVGDALLDAIGQPLLMHCPTFPETGRAVMGGELFVNGVPLASSAMRNHPVNPMTESDLVKVLGEQVDSKVGLVPLQTIRKGPAAVRQCLRRLARSGTRHAIIDAVNHDDLAVAAQASSGLRLTAGATGFGEALTGLTTLLGASTDVVVPEGPTVVLAGSCSETTLAQLDEASRACAIHRINVGALGRGEDVVDPAVAWTLDQLARGHLAVIAASASAEDRALASSGGLGPHIEAAIGCIAAQLVERGVTRLLVAGGETSGAVMAALEIKALQIGPKIDPGVPVVVTHGARRLGLILKSGNFGRRDLFIDPFGRELWRS